MPTDAELDQYVTDIRAGKYPKGEGVSAPHILCDDVELVISIPRAGNIGGPDIYRRKLPNGRWEDARNPVEAQNSERGTKS